MFKRMYDMARGLRRPLAALALFCALCSSAAALDSSVTDAYGRIDAAFAQKSSSEIDSILKGMLSSSNYDYVETYTLKKIRRLIVANDFTFAEEAILVVIDNNLDNIEAIEMYSTIEDSVEKQKEFEEEQERKRVAEEQRIAKAKEDQRGKADKEYKTAQTAEGSSVYVTGKDEKYTATSWGARLGIADIGFYTDADSDYNSVRYGLSLDVQWERILQKIVAGFDLFGEVHFVPFVDDDGTIPAAAKAMVKLAFPSFTKKFYVRAGFAALATAKPSDEDSTLADTLISPALGIAFNHVNLGEMVLSGFFDYYLGHLFYSDINSAFGAGLNLSMPMSKLDNVALTFNVGVNDNIFIKSAGVENRASVILAIGVENVSK